MRRHAHSLSARALRLGVAAATALLLPAAASASILVVDDDGTYDAATDGCDGTDAAYPTINAANTAAVDLDTIKVCPGTYNEPQIDITKALTFQGSGAATTIIDAGGGTGLTNAGTIRIRTSTGDVTFDGFTVRNPAAQGALATGLRFGISAKSSAPVTYTITNNVIEGTGNPAFGSDYGVYTDGPTALETFIFQYNTVRLTGSNPILIERHVGPTDVSFNTFDRGVFGGGVSAYFNMSHSGTAVTSLQKVSNNTIDLANDPGPYTAANASSGIVFSAAFTGGSVGTFSNVEISGNTITGIEAFRRGIVLTNNSSVAGGANGEISNAVVSCNELSGPDSASSFGIRVSGFVSNPSITGNSIAGVDTALQLRELNGHVASGVVFTTNSLDDIGTWGIDAQTTNPVNAENVWWDSPTGPTEAGNPGGTGAAIGATAGPGGSPVVDYTPWLESGADVDAGTCFVPAPPACNVLEPGQIFATKPKSKLGFTKINTDPTAGNDGLTLGASFTLPAGRSFSEISPIDEGVRVVLTAQDGSIILDTVVPAVAYDNVTKVGWKVSGNGKTWRFTDKTASPTGGIYSVVLNDKNSTKTPRVVKVTVKGRKSTYPIVEADVPPQAVVALGNAASAALGLCGESAYASTDCKFNKPKSSLTCRR